MSAFGFGNELRHGVTILPRSTQAFYKLMLKSPATAKPGLAAKAYHAELAELAGKTPGPEIAIASVKADPLPLLPVPAIEISGDDDYEQPLPPSAKARKMEFGTTVVAKPPPPDARLALDVAGEDDVAECGGPSSSSAAAATVRSVWPAGIPRKIYGQTVTFEPAVAGRYNARLRLACDNPAHGSCGRSRSMNLLVAQFGNLAPVAFLGAWLKQSFLMDEGAHARYTPSRADMEQFLSEFQGGV